MSRPLSVLIVEDSRTQALLLRCMLEQAGCVPCVAENAMVALDCIHAALPDLIVSDANMPGMSGIELLKALKHDATTRAVPFVLMTASDTPDVADAARAAGALAVIEKPISPEHLHTLIATLSAMSRPESHA